VIIAQDSIQRFINSVSPGAYASITKVDFKALDRFFIKPLGVYGSKSEIARLLRSIAVIDDDMYALLILIMSYYENVLAGPVRYLPQLVAATIRQRSHLVST
jgi:hypothetical protein